MRRLALTAVMCGALVASASQLRAQDPLTDAQMAQNVYELIPAATRQAIGLVKLSSQERIALFDWVSGLIVRAQNERCPSPPAPVVLPAECSAPAAPAGMPSATAAVIEARIDGEFSGWEGETIFRLDNGQIWQQAAYAYRYHYAYRPKVLIYPSGRTYKMRVDGINAEITVVRLK